MLKSRENLTGKRFGRLIVTNFSHSLNDRAYWECSCDCGGVITTRAIFLKRGSTISCRKCKHTDYTGRIINDIKVIQLDRIESKLWKRGLRKIYYWKCECKCGKIKIIPSKNISNSLRTFCSFNKTEYGKVNMPEHECFSDEQKKEWLHKLRLTHNNKRRCDLRNAEGNFNYLEFYDLCKNYNFQCLCCKKNDDNLHADHVIPISKGGRNSIENIQPLCQSCNSKKRSKIIDYRVSRNEQ